MQNDFKMLHEVLNRQKEVLQKLCGLCLEEEQAIVQGDIFELERLTKLEGEQVEILTALEAERIPCAQKAAVAAGAQPEATLAELCRRLGPDDSTELESLHNELKTASDQLVRQNEINQRLTQLQLRQINFMLESLTSVPPNTYTGRGTMEEDGAAKRSVLDLSV